MRVLHLEGSLDASIVDPIEDLQASSSYFGPRRFESDERRAGLQMQFAGWTRPLG